MSKLLHRVAHWLGWNYGRVETWHESDLLFVGFRCAGCGRLSGVHERNGDFI